MTQHNNYNDYNDKSKFQNISYLLNVKIIISSMLNFNVPIIFYFIFFVCINFSIVSSSYKMKIGNIYKIFTELNWFIVH